MGRSGGVGRLLVKAWKEEMGLRAENRDTKAEEPHFTGWRRTAWGFLFLLSFPPSSPLLMPLSPGVEKKGNVRLSLPAWEAASWKCKHAGKECPSPQMPPETRF